MLLLQRTGQSLSQASASSGVLQSGLPREDPVAEISSVKPKALPWHEVRWKSHICLLLLCSRGSYTLESEYAKTTTIYAQLEVPDASTAQQPLGALPPASGVAHLVLKPAIVSHSRKNGSLFGDGPNCSPIRSLANPNDAAQTMNKGRRKEGTSDASSMESCRSADPRYFQVFRNFSSR